MQWLCKLAIQYRVLSLEVDTVQYWRYVFDAAATADDVKL